MSTQPELIQRTLFERCVEFDRAMLRGFSDAQLHDVIRAIEAGQHDKFRVWLPDKPLPITLRAVAEEVERRGWLSV